jgi:hypothetical protein
VAPAGVLWHRPATEAKARLRGASAIVVRLCFSSCGLADISFFHSMDGFLIQYLFAVIGSQFTVFSLNDAKIEAFWVLIIWKLFPNF